MGQFRVTVTGVGGHGCQREVKDGATVPGCGQPKCPDCAARRFIADLKAGGANVEEALLDHWRGSPQQVTDNLLTGVRRGSF